MFDDLQLPEMRAKVMPSTMKLVSIKVRSCDRRERRMGEKSLPEPAWTPGEPCPTS